MCLKMVFDALLNLQEVFVFLEVPVDRWATLSLQEKTEDPFFLFPCASNNPELSLKLKLPVERATKKVPGFKSLLRKV